MHIPPSGGPRIYPRELRLSKCRLGDLVEVPPGGFQNLGLKSNTVAGELTRLIDRREATRLLPSTGDVIRNFDRAHGYSPPPTAASDPQARTAQVAAAFVAACGSLARERVRTQHIVVQISETDRAGTERLRDMYDGRHERGRSALKTVLADARTVERNPAMNTRPVAELLLNGIGVAKKTARGF